MDTEKELIKAVESGQNIFLTGGAGTGKTYLQNNVVEHFEDKIIVRTALTGLAALHVEGVTIHRFTGIGINHSPEQLKYVINTRKFRMETSYDIEDADIVFIDEISMMRSDTLELIDLVFQHALASKKPFGGKQVVFAGDFMQLGPVVKRDDNLPEPWAFQSPIWEKLDFKVINLTEVKRQDDKTFSTALNWIRVGRSAMNQCVEKGVSDYIFNTINNEIPEDVEPIKLVSTNSEAFNYNMGQMRRINEDELKFEAKINGDTDKLVEQIKAECPAHESLILKIGVQVMTIKNDMNNEYINGSMGELLGVENHDIDVMVKEKTDGGFRMVIVKENQKCLMIRLFDGDKIIYVPVAEWKKEKKSVVNGTVVTEVIASFKQYPIKLAYAITVHKSQGMSLDYLEIDFRRIFMPGQAYVALSRARRYEGLIAKYWSISCVKTDMRAYNFYMGLRK